MKILLNYFEKLGVGIAGASLCIVMILISLDAIFRYLFNSPLQWVSEIVSYYLLVIAIYFSVSSTYSHGDHINIDIFQKRLPNNARVLVDAILSFIFLIIFGLIGYLALNGAIDSLRNNEYMPGYFTWPVWLSYIPVSIGSFIFCIRLAYHLYLLFTGKVDPDVQLVHASSEGALE